jgi:hypothetical protein
MLIRPWRRGKSATTVRNAISLDESTGSERMQPDEDIPGVAEVEIPRREFETDTAAFVEHTVVRASKYLREQRVRPRVQLGRIISVVVRRVLLEGRPRGNDEVNAQFGAIVEELLRKS